MQSSSTPSARSISSSALSRLAVRHIADLQPHPSLVRLGIAPPAHEVSLAMERHSGALNEPVTVTENGYILAGQARWQVAQRSGETTIECLQLQLSEEESLLWLIHKQQQSRGLNDYNRIVLALELEQYFKDKARTNQRLGGLMKGSTKLTEAERLDVRAEIATASGTSVGSVSKVKTLLTSGDPIILEALRDGDLKIHRAFVWAAKPQTQCEQFRLYQQRRGLKSIIRGLQAKHKSASVSSDSYLDVTRLAQALCALPDEAKARVTVGSINTPECAIVVTPALLKILETQGALEL